MTDLKAAESPLWPLGVIQLLKVIWPTPKAKWGCLLKALRVGFNHPYFIFGVVEPPPRGIGGGSTTLKQSHPSYFLFFIFFVNFLKRLFYFFNFYYFKFFKL